MPAVESGSKAAGRSGGASTGALACPACHVGLKRDTVAAGARWECESCHGQVADVTALRATQAGAFARRLFFLAVHATAEGSHGCPVCGRRMVSVPTIAVPGSVEPVRLDACARCELVWFDPGEYEEWAAAPVGAAARINLPAETQRELDARGASAHLLELFERRHTAARRREAEEMDSDLFERVERNELGFKRVIPALFGLPVEVGAPALRSRPWVTWTLAVAIVVMSLVGFGLTREAFVALALVPAAVWRHGGLTLATSFFLHGGLWHLFGNLYFLLVFGDDVEDRLGRLPYLILIALSTFAGDMLHVAMHARSVIPTIGASGGISGVIAFYSLSFPRRRLRLMLGYGGFYRLVDMRASFAMALWICVQLVGAALRASEPSGAGVAYLAHLGGAGLGLGFWLMDRLRSA